MRDNVKRKQQDLPYCYDDPDVALHKRFNDHVKSIDATTNLNLTFFRRRFFAVDDIWIPLAESMVIE